MAFPAAARPLGAGHLSLILSRQNLTDEDYAIEHFNGGTCSVVPTTVWGPPRSLGLALRYQFSR
jgi:iron complex outermembrane recepter protein